MAISKSTILKILSKAPIGFLFKPFYSGEGSILFMHKVVLNKDKNASRIPLMAANEIEVDFLEKMILFLKKKKYEFISLDELHHRLENPKEKSKKFIVFTFDDGYKDNLTLAYPIFKKHNVPFTIYLTNCYPNKTAKLWWYMLEDILLENTSVSLKVGDLFVEHSCKTQKEKENTFGKLRTLIISSAPEKQNEIIEALEKKYSKSLQTYVENESLNWDEVKKLSEDSLVTIGGHSLNHLTFNKLNKEEILTEVLGSKQEIEKSIDKEVAHFAYPFGTPNEINQREVEILEENTNFKTATTTRMGNIFLDHKQSYFALPRIQVLGNQQNLSILNLYLTGVLPAIKNRFKKIVTL